MDAGEEVPFCERVDRLCRFLLFLLDPGVPPELGDRSPDSLAPAAGCCWGRGCWVAVAVCSGAGCGAEGLFFSLGLALGCVSDLVEPALPLPVGLAGLAPLVDGFLVWPLPM